MEPNKIIPCECGHEEIMHKENAAGSISCFVCVEWLEYGQDNTPVVHPYKPNNLGYFEQIYDKNHSKVFLLSYDDWEDHYTLGIFPTKEQAELWRQYFIEFSEDEYVIMAQDKEEREDRLNIEEWEIGLVNKEIKVDNLKYLEMKHNKNLTEKK